MIIPDSLRRFWVRALTIGILCLPLLVTTSALGKTSFERTYGGGDFDYGRSVRQTSDGGYVVTGETHSFGSGWGDVYLLRLDSLGDTLWSRTFGGGLYDCGRSVQETSEGGFIIVGETQSFGAGANDVYLIRTDSLGNTMWTGTYGGGDYDCGYSVVRTPDDEYLVAGETESSGAGGKDVYLLKTDFLGNAIQETTYGGGSSERGFDVELTSDGGYIIAGHTSSFGAGADDMYLVKTDDSGSVSWTETYGTTATEWGRSVGETPEGNYFIAGETRASGVFDIYLGVVDSTGGELWDTTYGGASHDRCMSCIQTMDGGFALVGYTLSFGAGDYDIYVVRVDSVGDTIWTRTFGGAGEDRGAFIEQTQDSGFIIVGYTESFGAGGYDVYLIKVGPDGVVALHDGAILSIEAPPDTVVRDSIYPVSATLKNLGNAAMSCDVVAETDGYSDTVHVADLPSDSAIQISFMDWHVPAVDSTTFTVNVCAVVADDVDTTNNCAAKIVFAYDPNRVAEPLRSDGPGCSRLDQNRPNPFSRETTISYSLPAASRVSLRIFDIAGRLVATLVDDRLGAGHHKAEWYAAEAPPGIYFCRLQAEGFSETRGLLLLR